MILSLSHLFPGRGHWLFAEDDGGGGGGGTTDAGDLFDDTDATGDDAGDGTDTDDAAKGDQLAKVLDLLAGCGIKLPDDTTPKDLLDNLETALIAYKHAKEHHGIEPPSGGAGDAATSPTATEEPMATTMSTDATATPAAVKMSAEMSVEFAAMKSRLARAEAQAAGERFKAIGVKLKSMVDGGMLSKATANTWWKELHTRQLSLVAGDDRTVSKILDQMEILEKEHPNRLAQVLSAQAAAAAEPAPSWVDFSTDSDGKAKDVPDTPEKAKKLLDEVYGKKQVAGAV